MATLGECAVLVARLGRTVNYPRHQDDVETLAQGLMKAANVIGVAPERIIERCAEVSQFCPTDADLLAIAREVRGAQPWQPRKPAKCQHCGGTGWRITYWLHTQETGKWNFRKRERITKEVYDSMQGQLGNNQEVYSAADRCTCPVPSDPTLDWGKKAAGDKE